MPPPPSAAHAAHGAAVAALPRARRPRCQPRRAAVRTVASAGNDAPRSGMRILSMPSFVPKNALIFVAKAGWTFAWETMMAELAPQSRDGAYVRPTDTLSAPVVAPAAPGRYVLYVGPACPWCHRATLTLALRGLGDAVVLSQLRGNPDSGGWEFTPAGSDPVVPGAATLRDTYAALAPGYTGRRTAPLLVDSQDKVIVSNESATICRLLNDAFAPPLGASAAAVELRPAGLAAEVDALNASLQDAVNDGVYKCGFATTQRAYTAARARLRDALATLDASLATRRFLLGAAVTEPDVRLFATIVRLDAVYSGLFKCALHTAHDFPHIHAWLQDVYLLPGVAATVDVDVYRSQYYGSLFPLNPGGVIPAGPTAASLGYGREPAGRAALGAGAAPFHTKTAV
jgi:putative glutathione S-transferase